MRWSLPIASFFCNPLTLFMQHLNKSSSKVSPELQSNNTNSDICLNEKDDSKQLFELSPLAIKVSPVDFE